MFGGDRSVQSVQVSGSFPYLCVLSAFAHLAHVPITELGVGATARPGRLGSAGGRNAVSLGWGDGSGRGGRLTRLLSDGTGCLWAGTSGVWQAIQGERGTRS